ncbi:MAG: MATE family efflux transporter, partial [Desulfuromonadales bacterium]|nr:MATE family efflux transporter [Desulfuromonadales bacterium]
MAYNLTDMIWVGRLGSNAVAAVGSAGFYLHLAWALISILIIGANIKISQSVGAKKQYSWGRFATTAVWGAVFLAFIYVLFLFSFAGDLIGFFRLQDVAIEQTAQSYLLISAGGILFSFLSMLFGAILNAHGLTTISFKAMVTGTLINVILDPILIFWAGLGVQGAAIATIIAQLVVVIYFGKYFLTSKKAFFTGGWLSLHGLKKMVLVGAPVSIQRIVFTLISIVLARIIAEWGPQAIAVQKIGVQIEAITYMFTGGLMQAMRIMVGQSFGARDIVRIGLIYQAGLKVAIGIGLVSSLLFLAVPGLLFSVFLQEPESIEMGKDYLMILGLSQIFMCIEMITAGAYHGMGLTRISATVSVIFTSLRIPLAYALGMWTFL